MQWITRHHRALLGLALVVLLGGAFACSSDSPSAPQQDPAPPPGSGGGSGNFNVTVTVTPQNITAGEDNTADVLVRVRNRSTGAAPANGTTAVVNVTLGTLNGFNSGITQAILTLINGEARFEYFPGDRPGTGVIQVEFQNSFGQATLNLREKAAFFLSFVDPQRGAGGDTVTIHGGGFERPLRVTFAGVAAQVLSNSSNQIRVEVPPAPGEVTPNNPLRANVTVTINFNEEGASSDTLNQGFEYRPGGSSQVEPVIFSIDPASGPSEGGTTVRVVGDNFQAPVRVAFGGIGGAVVSVTETLITVVTPNAVGLGIDNRNDVVDVVVTNLDSGFSDVLPQAFRYRNPGLFISQVSPSRGPQAGGINVDVLGQGFIDPVRVLFGPVVAQVLSSSDSRITVLLPTFTDDLLATESCDDNDDGQEGQRFVDTAVDVTVINFEQGEQDVLPQSFIIEPTDRSCRNDVAPPEPAEPPQADFSFTASGFIVLFENNSTGTPPLAFDWDFGDGNTSTERDPVHDYTAAGADTYVVTLTVTNQVGQTDTASQLVTVPAP